MQKIVRIGMLGFGTVGQGAYRMLQDNQDAIRLKVGLPLEIVKIGIKSEDKKRTAPARLFTTDLQSIIDDPTIDVILELIGGADLASSLVEGALRSGKHVVTANKELIAKRGSALATIAQQHKVDLHYEAAVGGGIPLIQPLKHQLAGNNMVRMMGILNGTSNYILSKMADENADFVKALAEAQKLGYAEVDPSSDVDGFDTAYKISILASIATGKQVAVDEIHREGIRSVTLADIEYAAAWDYRIKLLGIVDSVEAGVRVRVHPALVPKDHPLGSVNGVYNALWFRGDFVGDVMFSGRGAGSDPTGSAVIGDLIDVARDIQSGSAGTPLPYGLDMKTVPMDNLETAFYLRMLVVDKPKTLGEIAMVLGHFNVGLAEMEMSTLPAEQGEIVFLTHPAKESEFWSAIRELEKLNVVHAVRSTIRIAERI